MYFEDYLIIFIVVFGLGIALYMCWKPEPRQDSKDAVCDGCGQVTSELREGLCAWCINFYNMHK